MPMVVVGEVVESYLVYFARL